MLKKTGFALAVSLALCASLATAAAPAKPKAPDAKTALAMEVLDVTNFDSLIQSMRSQVAASIEQSAGLANACAAAQPTISEFGKALSDKLTETLMSSDFKVDVAAIYAETFDEGELRDIVAFYKTPLGKKLIARMPELTQKSMQISQDRIRTVMPDIQKISQEFAPRIAEATKSCPAPADDDSLMTPAGH
jgi:uncharacterized protein